MRRRRQIIALGGGGFSWQYADPKMCAYILERANRRTPRICFVPTGGSDNPAAIESFYRAARRLGAKPSHLSLFDQPREPFPSFVLRHDVIWVGGGNTRNLLLLWRAWGLDAALHLAYRRGVVLAGSSAGALCWFRAGVTDSFPGRYQELRCLGWLRGSFCPHYNSERKRRPVYRKLVREGILPEGYAADDNVGLHFVNERLEHIVASKRRRYAHRVVRHAGRVEEIAIAPDIIL